VELDPIYVRFRTEVPTHRGDDPSDYFTVLGGAVVLFKDDAELEIGDCSARLVHLSLAEEHAVSWHDVLDSLDADSAEYARLLEPKRDFAYRKAVADRFELYTSDLLILQRIHIQPGFRGNGYGLYVASAIIDTFGSSQGLVACHPSPFELNHRSDTPEFDVAKQRLRHLWSLLGFRPLPGTELYLLSTAVRRPSISDCIESYMRRRTPVR
jgi:hypothetical protein